MGFFFLESNFGLFIGRFHPLVVHLPIGFLLLAAIFHFASRRTTFESLRQAVGPAIFLGALSATLSVIFGLALANQGGYDDQALFWHKWLGIGVALISIATWLVYSDRMKALIKGKSILIGSLVLLLVLTGHLGGNLTHGEDYLLQYAPGFLKSILGQNDNPDKQKLAAGLPIDSLLVYHHLIQPVMEKKCLTCHNDKKQNGGLEISTVETLIAGGDHGEVLLAGNAMESELFHRVTLNPESKKFMPPKGSVMTFDEIKIMEWWINSGMSFETYLSEMEIPEDIKVILLRTFGVDAVKKSYVEKIQVTPVEEMIAEELKAMGFELSPLAENNHLLEVSVNDSVTSGEIEALLKAQEQITWLNLGGSDIQDDMLNYIGKLPNLTRLRLEKNTISDTGVAYLTDLKHLESLNLYGTAVTDRCLESIGQLPALKRVFLWQTAVTQEGVEALKSKREDLEVDLGFQFVKLE